MTIEQAIEQIKKWHQPFQSKKTRDTVKWGDPSRECTGVVTTCCATVEVIRQAAALGANLILSHESIFFGDEFALEDFGDNQVLRQKQALLDEHGIVVWRDHDHMHGMGKPFDPIRYRPDYIFYGLMQELGWEPYVVGDRQKPLSYVLPQTTGEALARELMEKIGLRGVRIVGDAKAPVTKVRFVEHVMGRFDLETINTVEQEDVEVMIPLEICDWTLSAYVRDAVALGKHKVILEMGHFNTEELGMKYLARLLPDILPGVPAHFVQSGDSFDYVVR